MPMQFVNNEIIQTCLTLSSGLIKLQVKHLWIDYDQEADVLYLGFRRPQKAIKTVEMDDGDVLVRTGGDDIVGITIMNASTR
jgi:uncharacterized protein YuzE